MQTKVRNPDAAYIDRETGEELAGVLTAISVVSKRLAKRLTALQRRDGRFTEGGEHDGRDDEARL
jgi:hypothetical protein